MRVTSFADLIQSSFEYSLVFQSLIRNSPAEVGTAPQSLYSRYCTHLRTDEIEPMDRRDQ